MCKSNVTKLSTTYEVAITRLDLVSFHLYISPANQQPQNMFDLLRAHIVKRIELTENEFECASTFFIPKKLRRNQFLLQQGEVCKALAFVEKGCLRCYSIDDNGEEHIVQFAIEDWWISDPYSAITGEPSEYSIDALEDSEVLLLERSAEETLLAEIPKFERLFRLLLENRFIANQRRINAALSTSAEERYLSFLKSYPAIAQRISQNQIASYLGITPQSLSRIRKELTEKK
jgi:CRP-like cAMP-binding protein